MTTLLLSFALSPVTMSVVELSVQNLLAQVDLCYWYRDEVPSRVDNLQNKARYSCIWIGCTLN